MRPRNLPDAPRGPATRGVFAHQIRVGSVPRLVRLRAWCVCHPRGGSLKMWTTCAAPSDIVLYSALKQEPHEGRGVKFRAIWHQIINGNWHLPGAYDSPKPPNPIRTSRFYQIGGPSECMQGAK